MIMFMIMIMMIIFINNLFMNMLYLKGITTFYKQNFLLLTSVFFYTMKMILSRIAILLLTLKESLLTINSFSTDTASINFVRCCIYPLEWFIMTLLTTHIVLKDFHFHNFFLFLQKPFSIPRNLI